MLPLSIHAYCKGWLLGFAACLLALFGNAVACANNTSTITAQEEREYDVVIDGKVCGTSRTLISEYSDGRYSVVTTGKISLNLVLFTFTYELEEAEEWHRGKLLQATTSINNNGTKSKLLASVQKDHSLVTKNAKGATKAPVFTVSNNYWHLPPKENVAKKFHVFEAETGEAKFCSLTAGNATTVLVQGEKLTCRDYQLRGDLHVDLAYDDKGRLAYQKSKMLGRVTELKLKSVQPIEITVAQR